MKLMKTFEIWLKIWKLINMLATFIYASGSGKGYISQPIFVTHELLPANTHKLFKGLYLFRVLT